MSAKIEKVELILKHVAEALNIKNCELIPSEEALRGDGMLSEFFTGKVRDKDTGEVIQAYLKMPPLHKFPYQNQVFKNECLFYSRIFPEIDKFQKEEQVKEPFDKFPQFFCGNNVPHEEYVALDNLVVKNYVLTDKSKFLDEDHLKLIFATYGKWHALTFVYKDQNKEKYEEMIAPIEDVFIDSVSNKSKITKLLIPLLEIVYKKIKDEDEHRAKKIKNISDNIMEYWNKGVNYSGKYSCFTHGDCWSNNMMFKYDKDNNIEDIRLVDLQFVRDSSPVHDLSYFFYSGASKKDFDKLDKYLDLYYESFSKFARELGSDPDKLLPLEALKADWKIASLLGIFMSLILWQVKLLPKEIIQDIGKEKTGTSKDGKSVFMDLFGEIKNLDIFVTNICSVVNHAIEYNII